MSAESVGLRNKLVRKVEELKNELDCSGIPDEFLCPITRELMREPVIAAGQERSAFFLQILAIAPMSFVFSFSSILWIFSLQMDTHMKEKL